MRVTCCERVNNFFEYFCCSFPMFGKFYCRMFTVEAKLESLSRARIRTRCNEIIWLKMFHATPHLSQRGPFVKIYLRGGLFSDVTTSNFHRLFLFSPQFRSVISCLLPYVEKSTFHYDKEDEERSKDIIVFSPPLHASLILLS